MCRTLMASAYRQVALTLTESESMLISAPGVMSADGLVQPQTLFGYEPPIATSKMTKNPWSTAAFQVASDTWFCFTENVWFAVEVEPELLGGGVPAVDDDRVGVVTAPGSPRSPAGRW